MKATMNNTKKLGSWLLAFSLAITLQVKAQDVVPHHIEMIDETLGPLSGNYVPDLKIANPDPGFVQTFDESQFVVTSKAIYTGAPAAWFQLRFDEVNMGTNSYFTITSGADGDVQMFTAKSLAEWGNHSAMFNGGMVTIQLHVAPNEKEIGFHIYKLIVADDLSNGVQAVPESQCGPNDDRTALSDQAIGRMMPLGCTGWLITNGTYVSAGHCCDAPASLNILEFNVPASLSNGTTVAAAVVDQYPVNDASIVFQNVTIGDDWCVFNVGVNSNTGKTAFDSYDTKNSFTDNKFFRVTHDNLPATTRITGYGVDQVPLGSSGGRNAQNQTEQTHTGPFVTEVNTSAVRVSLQYTVDTEGGNSGSPVALNGTRNSCGIHTNAGCNTSASPGANQGCSFEADDTETGIVNKTTGVTFVDENHPSGFAATGTVFRPYKTVNAGITGVTAGNVVDIAEGSYTETVITSKALTLRATSGMAVIGPSAPPVANGGSTAELAVRNTVDHNSMTDDIKVSPNPVLNSCIVEFSIEAASDVEIYIYNAVGQLEKVVLRNNFMQPGKLRVDADLSDLRTGVYYMQIKTGEKLATKKITKI
ncbi:MAG: T9SS type A sorting domain-containing protein [Bacteroidia bacterium]|nr:T9SS type A sorting domain-containing protein [Bacteroidia bacterium]